MTVLLMRAGKLRARTRSVSPVGEKHSTTCRLRRTLSMKKSHSASLVSMAPVAFSSLRTALHATSFSSGPIRSGMKPEDSKSLTYTRKRSLTMWESVSKNITCGERRKKMGLKPTKIQMFTPLPQNPNPNRTWMPFTPALVYSDSRSALNSTTP